MNNNELPSISVIIPTYNSGSVIGSCLDSITEQDYPGGLIELIIVDGGSTDNTIKIVQQYRDRLNNIRILENKLKTGEAGKALGAKAATAEIIALIDSDNILPTKDWFKTMVSPFADPAIVGTEPIAYTWRREDSYITRYCALIGMNDPLCLFLGNYDRYSLLTGKWTGLPVKQEDKGGYIEVTLSKEQIPTVGANGFMIRQKALLQVNIGDYLFDIDILCELINKYGADNNKIAKVKTGIVHIFSGNLSTFIRKQRRRIEDFIFFEKRALRKYPWKTRPRQNLIKFILYSIIGLPLFWQTIKGYLRKPDPAWFFHPIACWITLGTYGLGTIKGLFKQQITSRERWHQ